MVVTSRISSRMISEAFLSDATSIAALANCPGSNRTSSKFTPIALVFTYLVRYTLLIQCSTRSCIRIIARLTKLVKRGMGEKSHPLLLNKAQLSCQFLQSQPLFFRGVPGNTDVTQNF